MQTLNVAVVGGGIAGLVAASYAAAAGKPVALFERASTLGGRAQTTAAGDAHLNLGPHALFAGGPTQRFSRTWGSALPGLMPRRFREAPSASSPAGARAGTRHSKAGGSMSCP